MAINYDKDGNYIPSKLQVSGHKEYEKSYLWAKLKGAVPKVYISRFKPIDEGGEEILESRTMTEAEFIRNEVKKKRVIRTGIQEDNRFDEQ